MTVLNRMFPQWSLATCTTYASSDQAPKTQRNCPNHTTGELPTRRTTHGFNQFASALACKLSLQDIQLVRVNEHRTKTCCRCGEVRQRNRKHRSLCVCNGCGTVMNADINGTINTPNKYLRPLGRRANLNLARVIG